jgi:Spy/CpxP family protein refolding chaperone
MPSSGGMPSNNGDNPGAISGEPKPSISRENNTMSTVHSGLQLGPPGRWWDDKHYVKALHLRSEQQKRMDSVFEQNKANLVSKYQALQQEESKMEVLSHADALDEGALFAQIDRVAQARADLEKANTHMMLQVRKEMDADQTARLDRLH